MPRRERPPITSRSEHWLRVAVQDTPAFLNQKIRTAFVWQEEEVINWLSPVASDGYAEYYDEAFLQLLGLDNLRVPLREFWPRSGPRWDGLAVTDSGKQILVEAKAYPEEAVDGGSKSKDARSSAMIEAALHQSKAAFGVPQHANWSTPFYQYANRLAHLYYLAGLNEIDAYLVFVYFADAPDVPQPCSAAEWTGAKRVIEKALGLPVRHKFSARIATIVIPAERLGS
jgi:hypothetical protein